MNEQQRKQFYIAMCNTCTLANCMKDCKICIFRIGISNDIETWKAILEQVEVSESKMRELK
jgi:hypothetical protein